MTEREEERGDKPGLRAQLRRAVSALALGFLCCFFFTLASGPISRALDLLVPHLFAAPLARAAAAIVILGILQALISALALSLLGLLFEIIPAVALAAGVFASAVPLLVLLVAQGQVALSAPVLTAMHLLSLALGGLAGYLSARRLRRYLESRPRSEV